MGLERGLARSDTFQGHHIRWTAKFFEHTSGKKKLVKIGLFFRQITEASKNTGKFFQFVWFLVQSAQWYTCRFSCFFELQSTVQARLAISLLRDS